MNALVFQVIIILLPGFIWVTLEEMATRTGGWHNYERLIRALFYGIFTYITLYYIYKWCGYEFSSVDIPSAADNVIVNSKHFDEIALSIPVSLIFSAIWSAAKNRKIIIRFLQFILVTKKFGDEDVWDYLFNSGDAAIEYVHFRDFESKWVYCGWVKSFSDDQDLREIYMRDVIVYDFDGNIVSEAPNMYLSRKSDSINLEFPFK